MTDDDDYCHHRHRHTKVLCTRFWRCKCGVLMVAPMGKNRRQKPYVARCSFGPCKKPALIASGRTTAYCSARCAEKDA